MINNNAMQFQYLPINTACKLRKSFISKNISGSSVSYRYSMCHGDFYGTNSHRPRLWESFDNYTVISNEAISFMIRNLGFIPALAKLIMQVVVAAWNYFIYDKIIYRS